ncbi:MAG: hydrogenase maturation protease [Solirubrobacterales bacterium]|nr:hydrogenase maturation protease [Solirubrobacterales bacterium]
MSGYWEELERPAPDSVEVPGRLLRAGSRVRLRPRPGGDVFDLVLTGRTAVVEGIEQDMEGNVKLAVVVEDDPGRDLGFARQPGHRFFFTPAEVESLEDDHAASAAGAPRILVAGIGNVFLGDDGFGVALVDRLARRDLPAGVQAVDYGIRGMDLAFAMQEGYAAVVLLDATPRGQPPGTLYVIEVTDDDDEADVAIDAHGMDPVKVLGLVRSLGGRPPRTFVVGCEPQTAPGPADEDVVATLSEPVLAALEPAVGLVESLLADIAGQTQTQEVSEP